MRPIARDFGPRWRIVLTQVTSIPDLVGENYYSLLQNLHKILKPATYLEIGTYTGDSLACATCPSIAVDPEFKITTNVSDNKESCHLYRMTSDRFYSMFNPTKIFNRQIDFAFLDGMHLYEFLLRDFFNTEKHCGRNSIIALHDCIPTDAYIASRVDDYEARKEISTKPGWWTGDVWKVVLILKKYRPDLFIYAVDASPTGLILVTNLDAKSSNLEDNYFKICEEFGSLSILDYGLERFVSELPLISTAEFQDLTTIARRFWL